MVDEETRDVAFEPAGGAPVNRDMRDDPGVLEGEIASGGEGESAVPRGASGAQPPDHPPYVAPAAKPARATGFAAGALGGLIVSALIAGAGYYLLSPTMERAQEDANRLAGVETQAQSENATLASLDKRVGALEKTSQAGALESLEKRVGALESGNVGDASKVAAAMQAAQSLAKQATDLRADVDAARGEIPALAARVAKLESGGPATAGAGPDLSAVNARIDKIESALAAPKSETRVAPEKPSASDNAASIAIVAEAIKDRLAAGEPFAPELVALERLGVDPAALTSLRAVVDGAPTGRSLAASFEAVAPKLLAAASGNAQGGVVDRFLSHIRGLVRVRDLKETAGDDPAALVSQIEAACRRGDVGGALTYFAKLPAASRQAAGGDWPALAAERQAADAALQSISEAAIGRLAGAKP